MFSKVLTAAGSYTYLCLRHHSMTGSAKVPIKVSPTTGTTTTTFTVSRCDRTSPGGFRLHRSAQDTRWRRLRHMAVPHDEGHDHLRTGRRPWDLRIPLVRPRQEHRGADGGESGTEHLGDLTSPVKACGQTKMPLLASHMTGSTRIPPIPPTWTSKCRCGPVEKPCEPTSAISCPAATR